MHLFKWILPLVLALASFLAFSAAGIGADLMSVLPVVKPVTSQHAPLRAVQNRFDNSRFDADVVNHQLRKQRIEHYLERARYFQRHEWFYNRDAALERAQNILRHHNRVASRQSESSTYVGA